MIFKPILIFFIINEICSLYIPGMGVALFNLNKAKAMAYAYKAKNAARNAAFNFRAKNSPFNFQNMQKYRREVRDENEELFARQNPQEVQPPAEESMETDEEEIPGVEFVDMDTEDVLQLMPVLDQPEEKNRDSEPETHVMFVKDQNGNTVGLKEERFQTKQLEPKDQRGGQIPVHIIHSQQNEAKEARKVRQPEEQQSDITRDLDNLKIIEQREKILQQALLDLNSREPQDFSPGENVGSFNNFEIEEQPREATEDTSNFTSEEHEETILPVDTTRNPNKMEFKEQQEFLLTQDRPGDFRNFEFKGQPQSQFKEQQEFLTQDRPREALESEDVARDLRNFDFEDRPQNRLREALQSQEIGRMKFKEQQEFFLTQDRPGEGLQSEDLTSGFSNLKFENQPQDRPGEAVQSQNFAGNSNKFKEQQEFFLTQDRPGEALQSEDITSDFNNLKFENQPQDRPREAVQSQEDPKIKFKEQREFLLTQDRPGEALQSQDLSNVKFENQDTFLTTTMEEPNIDNQQDNFQLDDDKQRKANPLFGSNTNFHFDSSNSDGSKSFEINAQKHRPSFFHQIVDHIIDGFDKHEIENGETAVNAGNININGHNNAVHTFQQISQNENEGHRGGPIFLTSTANEANADTDSQINAVDASQDISQSRQNFEEETPNLENESDNMDEQERESDISPRHHHHNYVHHKKLQVKVVPLPTPYHNNGYGGGYHHYQHTKNEQYAANEANINIHGHNNVVHTSQGNFQNLKEETPDLKTEDQQEENIVGDSLVPGIQNQINPFGTPVMPAVPNLLPLPGLFPLPITPLTVEEWEKQRSSLVSLLERNREDTEHIIDKMNSDGRRMVEENEKFLHSLDHSQHRPLNPNNLNVNAPQNEFVPNMQPLAAREAGLQANLQNMLGTSQSVGPLPSKQYVFSKTGELPVPIIVGPNNTEPAEPIDVIHPSKKFVHSSTVAKLFESNKTDGMKTSINSPSNQPDGEIDSVSLPYLPYYPMLKMRREITSHDIVAISNNTKPASNKTDNIPSNQQVESVGSSFLFVIPQNARNAYNPEFRKRRDETQMESLGTSQNVGPTPSKQHVFSKTGQLPIPIAENGTEPAEPVDIIHPSKKFVQSSTVSKLIESNKTDAKFTINTPSKQPDGEIESVASVFQIRKRRELNNFNQDEKNFNNEFDKVLTLSRNVTESALGTILDNQKEIHETTSNSKKLTDENIDKILKNQKQVLETLKTDGSMDGDLLMIANIGENIMKDIEDVRGPSKRETKLSRTLRSKSCISKNCINEQKLRIKREKLPLTRLISDPNAKIDIPKTFDNIGSVTRQIFEDESEPLYHVRNLVGSAQDTILSALRVPPKQLIIPTSLSVMKDEELQFLNDLNNINNAQPVVETTQNNVEAINPMFSKTNVKASNPNTNQIFEGITNTFERVGSAVKDSLICGRETLEHANDIANNAKNIVSTVQNASPRFVVPPKEISNSSKVMMIAPRILDIVDDNIGGNERVGSASVHGKDFVRLGHIFDAVGISRPNAEKVELEKIVFSPTGPVIIRDEIPKQFKVKSANLNNVLRTQHKDMVAMENTLNSLEEARELVGATNLKDFLVKMKSQLKSMKRSIREEERNRRKAKRIHSTQNEPTKNPNEEEVTVALSLPNELTNPPNDEFKRFFEKSNINLEDLRPEQQAILGATNAVHFERLFKESQNNVANAELSENPKNDKTINKEDVTVALNLPRELMNPFMGRASENDMKLFLEGSNAVDFEPQNMEGSVKQKRQNHVDDDDEEVGTFMSIVGPALRPFMGYPNEETTKEFLGEYTDMDQIENEQGNNNFIPMHEESEEEAEFDD